MKKLFGVRKDRKKPHSTFAIYFFTIDVILIQTKDLYSGQLKK